MSSNGETSETSSQHLGDHLRDVAQASRDTLGEVGHQVVLAGNRVATASGSLARACVGAIQARPLTAMLIAFSVGYLGMRLTHRRS